MREKSSSTISLTFILGLAKCSNCDLSSNLWLCLFCGFLGCGRKYHDGTGGNNHQIDHFKETNHGVCVKLGTITPDGNACKEEGG